jgi:hypothetical protein
VAVTLSLVAVCGGQAAGRDLSASTNKLQGELAAYTVPEFMLLQLDCGMLVWYRVRLVIAALISGYLQRADLVIYSVQI